MRKQMFSKLLSGVLVVAGFALFIFVGKHVSATPNATGGADNQTVDRASRPSISAASLEKSVVFRLEGEPEDPVYWVMGGPSAKIAAGANANAVLSLDLIASGGAGNQRDDGVTTGMVSGRGTTIAIEVFATGVRTSLRGVILKFKFDASLLSYVKAENSAFPLAIPDASAGTNLAATTPATLAASGFLARAEFETVVDVTGREFAIGIESVTLAESSASQDELTTTSEISFNATPSPDFDGDGTVGFSDFLAFAGHFGTQRGDAAFDARFDLDGDGETRFSDFIVFARQFGTTVAPPPPSPAVAIPDANLRAVIEDSLGKADNAPITRADMAALTGFIAPNKGIRNLTGLEYATNLRHLYLSGVETIDGEWFNSNDISDLSPLSTLTNLTLLSLGINSISDISALSNLTNLTGLDLGINSISDISALSNLTNLTFLSVFDNDITDISALSNLTNLKLLYLDENSISDISPLVSNTGLGNGDRVYLKDNPLSSTSINTHIPALQRRGVTVEFDSSNGNGGGGTTTPPSDSPDLIVESLAVPAGTVTAGLTYGFVATVRNQGNASSASTTLRIYRTTGATISSDDVEVGTDAVSALSAGATSSEFISVNVPSDAGNYTFVACVDSVSGESNTGNNCSSGVSVNVSGGNDVPSPVVTIPDANLRAVIESALGKAGGAPITRAEMATLTRIEAPNKGIRSIAGLKHAINLTLLELGGAWSDGEWVNSNDISDLAPLSNLTNLTWLSLSNNSISDISALSNLTNLQGLGLGDWQSSSEWVNNNDVSDLSPLSNLTKLTSLWLAGNSISDISALSNLTNLESLGLRSNNISDISALSNLAKLIWLWLAGNSISDISALSNLTNLQRLELDNNSISDISALSNLTNLNHLFLGDNTISDISILAGLTELTKLGLGNNNISDISILAGLTELTGLDLGNNNISDISALANLTNLTSLYLSSNNVSDISALANLTNLTSLYLSSNNVSDISALANLTNLTFQLDLSNNNISDISALSGLNRLKYLFLSGNNISDLSPLAANMGLGEGDYVNVRNNPLSATSLNTHIPNLQRRGVTVRFDSSNGNGGGGGGTNLGACRVGLVVRPNQRCTVSGGAFINVGGGCYNYTPFGTGRICSGSFNLNGLQGTRAGDDFRITAVP